METRDADCSELGVGLRDGVGEADGAGGVFDDQSFEAEMLAVDGGEADAEVVGEPAEEEALKAPFAEVSGESGGGDVVVLEEGGVGVDVGMEALAEDELGVGGVEAGMEGSSLGVLEAVIGPEHLGAVRDLDLLVGLGVGVVGGEGDVVGRMPILGEDDVPESGGERVDEWNDRVSVGDLEGSAETEVVLEIDDEKSVVRF